MKSFLFVFHLEELYFGKQNGTKNCALPLAEKKCGRIGFRGCFFFCSVNRCAMLYVLNEI